MPPGRWLFHRWILLGNWPQTYVHFLFIALHVFGNLSGHMTCSLCSYVCAHIDTIISLCSWACLCFVHTYFQHNTHTDSVLSTYIVTHLQFMPGLRPISTLPHTHTHTHCHHHAHTIIPHTITPHRSATLVSSTRQSMTSSVGWTRRSH